jgi:hypothetical protein
MHKYRPQLLEKISGVILIGEKDKSVKASLGFRTAKNSDKTALINSFVSYLDVFMTGRRATMRRSAKVGGGGT